MINFFKRYRFDLIIFAIALIVRIFLFSINLSVENGNLDKTIHGDDGYYEISRSLVAGHGFTGETNPPFNPNPLRTPLYPYFIAIILFLTNSYWFVIITQIIIGALIPVLGRRLSLKIVDSEKISFIVGLILALEPYLVLFSSVFYTETIFIFLFILFSIIFISYLNSDNKKTLAWSAFVLGLATLTKTTPQFLPLFILPVIYLQFCKILTKKQIAIRFILFLLIFLATLSPWIYRNYNEFGKVGMTAQPAYNVYVYLVPSVLSIENNTGFSEELNKWATPAETSTDKITLANGAFYIKKSLPVIFDHPQALLSLVGISFVTFFTHDGMLTVLQHAGITPDIYPKRSAISLLFTSPVEFFLLLKEFAASPLITILFFRVFWMVVTIAFFVGSIVFIRKKKYHAKGLFALILVLYFLITTPINGLGVNARFRMPVNAIILTFAVYGILRPDFKERLIK